MVPVPRNTASVVRLMDDATDPVAKTGGDDAPTDPAALDEHAGAGGQGDGESPAPDQEAGRRSFFARIGGRGVVVPLACVAAFLVGFAFMTAVLRLTDDPGPPDAKPAPRTAHPGAPAPAAAPAIATQPTSAASAPAVESEPPPPSAPEPAPAPQAETPEPSAPPSSVPPSTTTPNTTTPTPGGPGRR
jgi:hypothetical protein